MNRQGMKGVKAKVWAAQGLICVARRKIERRTNLGLTFATTGRRGRTI
jgi:hypothetical protein